MLPETKRPQREIIWIGNVPFRLNDAARASSGAGMLVSATASFSPKLTDALRGVLDGRTSLQVLPMFEAVFVRSDFHASRLVGLGVTVTRAFAGGLSGSLNSDGYIRRNRAPDPLCARRRTDRNVRLGVRVLHRSLRYAGFAPYIGYAVERNRSNIPVQAYRRGGVFVGVSRRF